MQEPFNHNDRSGEYRTGAVEPRPKHSGLVALLLIAVIVLSGVCTILGAVNARLFSALTAQPHADISAALAQTPAAEPEADADFEAVTIQIESEPLTSDSANWNTTLTPQQIFLRCAPSLVGINADGKICSGIVINENGYIITDCHFVENAKRITVHLRNNERLSATLVGQDWASGLAVLHIDAENLPAAAFGDSEELAVGDEICTLSPDAPQAQRGSIRSITRRTTCNNRELTLLQTDAAMAPGTPLINLHGQIVGIHTANSILFGGESNLTIPSAVIKQVAEQLIAQGHVSGRPTLGIWGQTISQRIQNYYDVPAGLLIDWVAPKGPASNSLLAGDILTALNGTPIASREDFARELYGCQPGQVVRVTIYRSGTEQTLQITVTEEGAF